MSRDPLEMIKALPPVVKNLLIINVLLFAAKYVMGTQGFDLEKLLALYYPASINFKPVQLVSHMFMHANFLHIAMNMYGLYLFGTAVEYMLGSKRTLIFYFVCGFGAALFAILAKGGISYQYLQTFTPDLSANTGIMSYLNNGRMVGASGAIYGLLMAYAYLNPNRLLQFIFIPFSFKAWNMAKGLFVFEFLGGLNNNFLHIFPSTGFAHFAHLGGLVFGYILMKIWKIQRS